jgi:hypothetical protein
MNEKAALSILVALPAESAASKDGGGSYDCAGAGIVRHFMACQIFGSPA